MTPDLHDRIDDLVADVPAYVVPDVRAAWAAGARRRTRHRIVVGAAALVTLALLASAVSWLPRTSDPAPADGKRSGVQGYPTRVDEPWLDRKLPDRPGPIAGILETADGTSRVVSETGRAWTLDQGEAIGFPLAVSAEGTKLAYFEQIHQFVLRDLVTGQSAVAADVGDGSYGGSESEAWGRYWVSQQAPAFWSPAGDRVFVMGIDRDDEDARDLLIGGGDSTRAVRPPEIRGQTTAFPAGWTSDGDLVWVDGDDGDNARWATVVVTTATGKEVRRVDLDLPETVGSLAGQWTGSVSPDGHALVLLTERRPDRFATLFSLDDGSVVRELPTPDGVCPISWSGSGPATSSAQGDDDVVVRNGDGSPMIVADPALAVSCGIWSTDALSGEPRRGIAGGLLGARQGWVAWHWQEVALGALALAGVALLIAGRRRRRLERTS